MNFGALLYCSIMVLLQSTIDNIETYIIKLRTKWSVVVIVMMSPYLNTDRQSGVPIVRKKGAGAGLWERNGTGEWTTTTPTLPISSHRESWQTTNKIPIPNNSTVAQWYWHHAEWIKDCQSDEHVNNWDTGKVRISLVCSHSRKNLTPSFWAFFKHSSQVWVFKNSKFKWMNKWIHQVLTNPYLWWWLTEGWKDE